MIQKPSPAGEFDLIRRCFCSGFPASSQTRVGIGDDASVVTPPPQHQLLQSIDTQVADVHFPATAPAHLIAQRTLRCAASDLAAMGATPQGFFLALTLPQTDRIQQQPRIDWLDDFAAGLRAAAHHCQLSLIGGDTTGGEQLVISCLVQGWVSADQPSLLRSGASAGDDVWVTGVIGQGALALPHVLKRPAYDQGFAQHYYFPQPRLKAGQALRCRASSALDISDGLLQDAGHIATASQVAIRLYGEKIPTAAGLGHPDWPTCLTGGDDYELLFTAPASQRSALATLEQQLALPLTRIGECVHSATPTVELLLEGQPLTLDTQGFQHF